MKNKEYYLVEYLTVDGRQIVGIELSGETTDDPLEVFKDAPEWSSEDETEFDCLWVEVKNKYLPQINAFREVR
jgi:hypothetical protein